ncbi:putative secreted protein [Saccharothrix espanaensis DSM 44229]|uniref:Putative secreted protein n=1 Tax=Saccharothrix espanaensis (strain ATCC 51144 / DSM 44229 / JCM 9112 / NBRC 15066 / NRRL 15764) TaxID=1179773 RepID=K0JYE5_SACES|nr:putative secreted protein [Saccharothrix espanaensis DSM 44229]
MRRRLAAALVTALAFLMASVTSAQAEGANGGSNYYDGKDPAATGCNVNASQIATRPILDRNTGQQVASIQIFYSWSCGANWIRVTGNPYGGNATKYIASSLGGWNSEWDPGYGSSYSMMVYAPGTAQINGYVYLFEPGINEWNWRAEGTFSL